MSWLFGILFISFFLVSVIATSDLIRPTERIVVGFLKREPFIYANRFGTLKGLDISIMDNFASKYNLELEFVEQNISLNEMSNNNELFSENYIQHKGLQ